MYLAELVCYAALFVGMLSADICPDAVTDVEVDWERMSELDGTWYDVIEMPPQSFAVDCFDWSNFTVVKDGFTVTSYVYTEGGESRLPVKMQYVRNEDGSYKLSTNQEERIKETVSTAIAHKGSQIERAYMGKTLEAMLIPKYFFITDYENYFILGACVPIRGVSFWAKFREQKPDPAHVIDVWNAIANYKIVTPVTYKNVCVEKVLP